MAFDGIFMSALSNELNEKLSGGKIEKIYQPESDALIISIQNNRKKYNLFLSASANLPHFTLIDKKPDNPATPPMFCMLLRKYLSGGIVINIHQEQLERVIYIDIIAKDEMGHPSNKRLIIEIMGKHSNIIFVEPETMSIIDSIKRIPISVSRVRQILPALKYTLLETSKLNLLTSSEDEFNQAREKTVKSTKTYKWLYQTYMGMSPIRAESICTDANISADADIKDLTSEQANNLWICINKLKYAIISNLYNPAIIIEKESEQFVDFCAIELSIYKQNMHKYTFLNESSVCEVVNIYFSGKEKRQRIHNRSLNLKKFISQRIIRNENKYQKLIDEQLKAEDSDIYKIYGDLLLGSLHNITQDMDKISLINYYDPESSKITITLDKRLTPSQNAQKYYKKYNKSKTARSVLLTQIKETEDEIKYLNQVLYSLENSSDPENIEDIRTELIQSGFLKHSQNKKKKNNKRKKPTFLEFISSDGFSILVGKNNMQNDLLTLKTASKKDIWLHTKIIAGSHVIIQTKGAEVPERTISEAAHLAAWYSKAQQSSQVPVDYTLVKNVSKPNGAKPGMVIYLTNQTIYVTPNKEIVERLLKE